MDICSDCNGSKCRCNSFISKSVEPNNDNDDYDLPTLYDQTDCDYNLSTLFDETYENNIVYKNATIENNMHDQSSNNNVHDLNLPSMRAHCMLNLGLKKKGFNMGTLKHPGNSE